VLELQYVDASSTKGALTVKYPLGTTVAFMDAQATALASLIAPITGAVLIRQRIIYKAKVRPLDTPDEGTSIVRCGLFVFSCDIDNPNAIITVPALLDSLLVTSGPTAGYEIDETNSDVETLVTLIEDDIWCNPFADDIVQLEAGYIVSRT
jgi:hypothetical protein